MPDTNILNGTGGVVDAAGATLTDSTLELKENVYKGFSLDIIFDSDTGNATVSASGKTATVSPSPAWTVDEHIGRYIYLNDVYFYILSNTL